MARRYYSSTAARTTLAAGVDGSTVTLSVTAVSGWPTQYPYTLIIDKDTVNEELVSVSARSGTTLTVTRGVDGTSGTAHSAGATVEHGVSARDFDEPNAFINGTGFIAPSVIDAKGDLLAGTADNTVGRLAVGTNGYILRADSAEATGLEWYDLPTDLNKKVDYSTPVNAQTGTTYTFVADDGFRITTSSNVSGVTFTIPAASAVAWPDNTILRVVNYGAGALTVEGGSGVTVTNTASTIGQYAAGAAIRTGSDAWTLVPFGGKTDVETEKNFQSFSSSGSFTVPAWATKMYYLIVRGGETGATANTSTRNGGVGGAGGQVLQGDTAITGGASLTITVGGAGSNSSVAISGGSTFTASSTGAAGGGSNGGNGANGTTPTGVFAGFTLAGGGGGGAFGGTNGQPGYGGFNGGGGGGKFGVGQSARANTGGGGGGGSSDVIGGPGQVGGSGGSGIVFLYFS